MIVVSFFFSAILVIGALIYYFIYPKKKINLFYLLILISCLPLISILRPGSYESGDLSLHAKYAMGFFDNLTQGNLIPRWMGNDCTNYGCPEYIFIFFLPYYIISFFHAIGFSFIMSVKLLLIGSFITSGIGMYLWIKDELGEKAGFTAAIFYLFAPYHLIDLHFRVSIGEILSYAILPFVLYLLKKLIKESNQRCFILTSLSFMFLILSHQVTAFISAPILLIYAVYAWIRQKTKKYRPLLISIFSLFIGGLLAAFYWLPLITEAKYIWYSVDSYIGFHNFWSFIYTPNRFFLLFQGHKGELYTGIGYTQIFALILSAYLLIKNKITGQDRKLLILLLTGFLTIFTLMQSFTKTLWDAAPAMKSIQFTWRMMLEISLITAVIAGIVVKNIKSQYFFILICIATIGYTILNWGNRKTEPTISDQILASQPVFQEEQHAVELTTPRFVDRGAKWIGVYPKEPLVIIKGRATTKTIKHEITRHEYLVNASTPITIRENTYYYPGWKVLVNNQETAVNYQNKDFKGVITFDVPKGVSHISVIFTDTWDRLLGKIISLVTLLVVGVYTIARIKPRRFKTIFSSFSKVINRFQPSAPRKASVRKRKPA